MCNNKTRAVTTRAPHCTTIVYGYKEAEQPRREHAPRQSNRRRCRISRNAIDRKSYKHNTLIYIYTEWSIQRKTFFVLENTNVFENIC